MVWTRCTRSFTGYIERLPRLEAVDARKSLPQSREARTKHAYTSDQAALLKTFFMPACIGAAISVVSF